MKRRMVAGATLAVALLVSGVMGADGLKSGPQVGESPSAFNPLHCNGKDAGKKLCLV